MANLLDAVARFLQAEPLRHESDADLLARFADERDQAAFRVLAERHGPMVFGVCQRVLRCAHDAEDALQAVFLVLSRKAASIRKSESLSCWLHGAARHVALRSLRERQRRRQREAAAPPPATEPTWSEAAAALDEELQRLPACYREALVLCCLEGLTRDEAASRLGVEIGVVKGRLERGRRMLADRLEKRGVALSAGLLAALSPGLASAAVRAALATATPTVVALADAFMKGMIMTKLKLIGAGLACALVLVAGVGLGTAQDRGKVPPAALGDAKDSDEAFIRRLSQDLRGCAPSAAEVHFFVASGDPKKRQNLVDLFIKDRAGKKEEEDRKRAERERQEKRRDEFARSVRELAKARRELVRMPVKEKLAELFREGALSKAGYEEGLRLSREKEKSVIRPITLEMAEERAQADWAAAERAKEKADAAEAAKQDSLSRLGITREELGLARMMVLKAKEEMNQLAALLLLAERSKDADKIRRATCELLDAKSALEAAEAARDQKEALLERLRSAPPK